MKVCCCFNEGVLLLFQSRCVVVVSMKVCCCCFNEGVVVSMKVCCCFNDGVLLFQ